MVRKSFYALSWDILTLITLISSTPIAAVSFTLGQGKERRSILYSDKQSSQIPIENTSAWQLLDYLMLISLPPSIHSNHWLHFSIYFTINASGPTEQSSDESMAQSISLGPQLLVKVCLCMCVPACVCVCMCSKMWKYSEEAIHSVWHFRD